ncbi:MAG: hypothetical protein HY367_02750, partial [Candidatus Aenigmarchaeota archaeon]|nr:hypothetical protein [Candidatus Aenigmarchaeota archaeon]
DEHIGEIPEEAYVRCREQGGEMVVRKDGQGRIVYAKCVLPGNEDDVYVEPAEEVPDTARLLQIAVKLEELKKNLDELARKMDSIADYYESTGSDEAGRYRRIADMFRTAGMKADEIREKLRSRLGTLTKEDINEIKHDIKYIKAVMLKDILYYMLSSSEDAEKITRRVVEHCTSDGCFDRAFRACITGVTYRQQDNGPLVEIAGLEGDTCVIKASLESGPGGTSYGMTCKVPEYSLGLKNPEKTILPYCSGSMVDLIRKFMEGSQLPPGFEGPGGCNSVESCREYCSDTEHTEECVSYLRQQGGGLDAPVAGEAGGQ